MSSTAVSETVATRTGTRSSTPRFFRNPWRHPWLLEGFTWLYLIWSIAPIALAVLLAPMIYYVIATNRSSQAAS